MPPRGAGQLAEEFNLSDGALCREITSPSPRPDVVGAYFQRFETSPSLRRLATMLYGSYVTTISAQCAIETDFEKMAIASALDIYRLKRVFLDHPRLLREFPNNESMNRVIEAHRRKFGDGILSVERPGHAGLRALAAQDSQKAASVRASLDRIISGVVSEEELQAFYASCVADEDIMGAVNSELYTFLRQPSDPAETMRIAQIYADLLLRQSGGDAHDQGAQRQQGRNAPTAPRPIPGRPSGAQGGARASASREAAAQRATAARGGRGPNAGSGQARSASSESGRQTRGFSDRERR